MKRIFKPVSNDRQKGQSLVEVALFLPILIILIAGVVEVSHLAITQNRVSNAARVGARFAANGGQDDGMWVVTLNSVTQTLELDEGRWDIWAIRATLDGTGQGFADWRFSHIYGISNTARFAAVNEAEIREEVLKRLQTDASGNSSNPGIASDLRVAGTLALYDAQSILGLDALPWLRDMSSIRGLNVMRISGIDIDQTSGCTGFPIAVHEGIRSVTAPGEGSNPYPAANEFTDPNPPPRYESFIHHVPNVPLSLAKEGTLFKVQNGSGQGNFGWLVWNEGIAANATVLAGSLTWPGDSDDYLNHRDGGQVIAGSGYNHVVRGYIEPGDATDQAMQIGDWVAGSTGAVNSEAVRTALNEHLARGRTLRLLVWDDVNNLTGNNARYKISGFAIFKILGHRLQSNQNWILAEFIRWDNSCGQLAQ